MKKDKIYPKDSAGSLMSTKVPVMKEGNTVGEAISLFRDPNTHLESLNYLYLVDDNNHLESIISAKQLFQSKDNLYLNEMPSLSIVSVDPYEDQERVALKALSHNFKSMPVVGEGGELLGVVTSDTLLHILAEEHAEDLLHAGGVEPNLSVKNMNSVSLFENLKSRLPWLLIGLAGGIFAAILIGRFEEILESLIMLVFFIPLIVYMSDAVASQTQMIFVRAIALDSNISFKKYFLKELAVALMFSIILGAVLGSVGLIWFNNITLAIILSVSLALAVMVSVIVGLLMPVIFTFFKKDPAIASGPFATIVIDITTIIIYFSVSSIFISIAL